MIYYSKLYYYNTIEYYLMYFFNDTIFIRYLYTPFIDKYLDSGGTG